MAAGTLERWEKKVKEKVFSLMARPLREGFFSAASLNVYLNQTYSDLNMF